VSTAAVIASVSASVAASASAVATSTPTTGAIESFVTSTVPSLVASALPSAITTAVPLTAQAPLGLPVSFEVAAIFAGALSGGILAVNRKFDITGVLLLAVVNGLGGGIMRDVLLQNQGIFALDTSYALYAVLAASVVAMFFASIAEKLRPALIVVDALSLSLFCLVGADKALVGGLTATSAVLIGTITSAGGGVLRDILCAREPQILRRGSLYGLAAIVGSSVYVSLVAWLHFAKPVAMIAAAVITLVLRSGSLILGWESPEPFDLTEVVVTAPRTAVASTVSALKRLFGRRG